MIKPTGYRVLIKQDDLYEHDEDFKRAKMLGLQLSLDNNVKYQYGVNTGVVVGVGPTSWKEQGQEWAKVGDHVCFAKNSGSPITDPNEKHLPTEARTKYVLLNDEDILAVLTED
jgi:co-chaperonin GroES (HSP10)